MIDINIYNNNLEKIRKDWVNKVEDSFDYMIDNLAEFDIKDFENILPLNINDPHSLEILISGLEHNEKINSEDKFRFLKQFVGHDDDNIKSTLIDALGNLGDLKDKTEVIKILNKYKNDDSNYIRECVEDSLYCLC